MNSFVIALIATACIMPCHSHGGHGLLQGRDGHDNGRFPGPNGPGNNNSTNNGTNDDSNGSCPQVSRPFSVGQSDGSDSNTYLLVALYAQQDPVAVVSVYQVTSSASVVSFLVETLSFSNSTDSDQSASNNSTDDHHDHHGPAPNVSTQSLDALPTLPDGALYSASGLTCDQVKSVLDANRPDDNNGGDNNGGNNNSDNNSNGNGDRRGDNNNAQKGNSAQALRK